MMATDSHDAAMPQVTTESQPAFELNDTVKAILNPLASLKLTVVLFALAIFIIFVGTLAQVDKDMWEVIELYFRSWIAIIDIQLFFPRTWFPDMKPVTGKFPAPGGALIGFVMALNLLAAHLVRFKIQAKGSELLMGLVVIGLGSLVTYWVIVSGHNGSGLQGEPPFSWEMLWRLVQGSLLLIALTSVVVLATATDASKLYRMGLLTSAITFGILGAWSVTTMPSPSSLRILWQLIQGGLAGLILLAGCMLAFKKRAGIVLLHAGIGLIMFSEVFVAYKAVEGRMSIREGETMNYVRDIRTTELAIVSSNENDDTENVIVVPGSRLVPKRSLFGSFGLTSDAGQKVTISDPKLPFDIHVEQFIKNADLLRLDLLGVAQDLDMLTRTQRMQVARFMRSEGDSAEDVLLKNQFLTKAQLDEVKKVQKQRLADNWANAGAGTELIAEEIRAASGTDGGEVDLAAAYIDIRKKGSDESLGRFMLSQILTINEQKEQLEVDGKKYDVALRFKRDYLPYSLTLKDVRKDDYIGSTKPKNYSSDVVLMDTEANNKVGDFRIWMNNPLRYAGKTFYQSGYTSKEMGGGIEATDLQVVTNGGWMMPYVGCMLVTVGMLVHFSGTLWRFLSRISRQQIEASETAKPSRWDVLIPGLIVLVFALYVTSKMRPPTDTKANMQIHELGRLPVAYQGRIKPLDTLARNTLRVISNKETADDFTKEDQEKNKRRKSQIPAMRWLADVIAGAPEANKHKVYRIDNLDVLETLGLQRRKGFRYALEEFQAKIPELENELKAMPKEPEERSFYQRKLAELERRLRAQRLMEVSFDRVIPDMPTEAEFKADQAEASRRAQSIIRAIQNLPAIEAALNNFEPPLSVPMLEGDAQPGREWLAFSTAWNEDYAAKLRDELGLDPATTNFPNVKSTQAARLWDTMLTSYANGRTKPFNDALAEYQSLLDEHSTSEDQGKLFSASVLGFEYFFNYSRPFTYCLVMYIVAFLLVCIAWILALFNQFRAFRVLNRSAFWLLAFTLVIHTFGLAGRVYISGRPPVTNLYSSAVFIGLIAVAFALGFEFLLSRVKSIKSLGLIEAAGGSSYAIGIGSIVASVSGFSTLQIAYALAADGDTFTVLQAVLDTQFWLATHVVCITIGYSTTFLAGAFGIVYMLTAAWRNAELSKVLANVIYGTLCFALFFSFVGTVLGGLWADDSWGRFWGWDPKENGALIIVLWNALILHARWGNIVKEIGMAVLAVLGNITTAWSWFGVNELGVGLHSYGFTEGVLRNLSYFVLSQIAVVGIGLLLMQLLPKKAPSPQVG